VQKSLCRRQDDAGFGALLGRFPLAAALMEHGRFTQREIQAKRVGELLCQGHGFLDACPRLVRIAQVPQRRGGIAAAQHPGILPMEEHRGAVLLGIVESYALGKMRVRRGDRAQLEARRPHVTMRRHKHRRVLDVVRQGQELLT
jgi:hypothetical protein